MDRSAPSLHAAHEPQLPQHGPPTRAGPRGLVLGSPVRALSSAPRPGASGARAGPVHCPWPRLGSH
eukprot:1513862-Alexandrium_andersonii.AAC.1